MIWFGLVLWYITLVGYLMLNPLLTHILNIYDLVYLVLWHIKLPRSFNAKSSLYIYIKCTGCGLVGLYGILTIEGYSMQNLINTFISNIWFVNMFFDKTFQQARTYFGTQLNG